MSSNFSSICTIFIEVGKKQTDFALSHLDPETTGVVLVEDNRLGTLVADVAERLPNAEIRMLMPGFRPQYCAPLFDQYLKESGNAHRVSRITLHEAWDVPDRYFSAVVSLNSDGETDIPKFHGVRPNLIYKLVQGGKMIISLSHSDRIENFGWRNRAIQVRDRFQNAVPANKTYVLVKDIPST